MDILKKNEWFSILLSEHGKWYSKDRSLFWRTALHSGALAHHLSLALWAPTNFEELLLDDRFKPMKKFLPLLLTLWNMTFQVLYLSLALWTDACDWRHCRNDLVRRVKDVVFSALVVPFSMYVAVTFWLIYHIDREQVFPTVLDDIVPAWINHGSHTSILPVVALELAVQPRRVPADHAHNLKLCWFFSVMYAVLYYSVYFIDGCWLYPVFAVMTWWQICLFQLTTWLSMHLFYLMQWPVVVFFHGTVDNDRGTLGRRVDEGSVEDVDIMKTEERLDNDREFGMCSKCIEYCICG